MKTRLLLALLAPCLLAAGAALAAPPPEWTGNINVALGIKAMEDDWEPVDDQTSFGFLLDFRRPEWPVNLAVDLLFSWEEENATVGSPIGPVRAEVDGSTTELDIGVRKLWEDFAHVRKLTPYVGGGIAIVWAEASVDGPAVAEDEEDTGLGLWLGGGAYFTLAERVNLGVDLRYSYAEVDLLEDVNGGGFRASLFAGYHW